MNVDDETGPPMLRHFLVSHTSTTSRTMLVGVLLVTVAGHATAEAVLAGAGDPAEPDGFRRLNVELIRPPGPYSFLDTSVRASCAYTYRLLAIDRSGRVEVAAIQSVVTAWTAEESEAPGAIRLAIVAAPSPGRAPITVRLNAGRGDVADVVLHAANGRRVRRLHQGPLAAGSHLLTWNGLDDGGREASAGVYLLRVRTGDATRTAKLVLVR